MALYRALGACVARWGMCCRHATLGAQQNPRHCGVPGRTAGVEEARSRGQDEKNGIERFGTRCVRLARGGTWEVVRPRNSHVGRRYELCRAHAATVARGVRGGRRGSPGSRAHMLAFGRRTLQVPKRRRAYALDVLSTGYQHPGLPPVAQSCARGMGGMTMRPSRRCLVRLRRTAPTHCVDLCIKVGSQRPATGRRPRRPDFDAQVDAVGRCGPPEPYEASPTWPHGHPTHAPCAGLSDRREPWVLIGGR